MTDDKQFNLQKVIGETIEGLLPKKVEVRKIYEIKAQQSILNEEKYIEGMEKIIRRDYYPDLCRIDAYDSYTAQKEKGKQNVRIPSILVNPTPNYSTQENENRPKERSESAPPNLKLDEYLATYTSKDNQSFAELYAKDKERKLRMFRDQFENKQLAIENTSNAITGSSVQAIEDMKNPMFFQPEGHAPSSKILALEVPEEAIQPKEINNTVSRFRTKFLIDEISKEKQLVRGTKVSSFQEEDPEIILGFKKTKTDGVTLDALQEKKFHKKIDTPVINGFRIIKDSEIPIIPDDFTIFTWGEIIGEPKLIGELAKATYNLPTHDEREEISIDIHRQSRRKLCEESQKKFESYELNVRSKNFITQKASTHISQFQMTPGAKRLLTSIRRTDSIFREALTPRK